MNRHNFTRELNCSSHAVCSYLDSFERTCSIVLLIDCSSDMRFHALITVVAPFRFSVIYNSTFQVLLH
uniref:Uncharacterized protein n=1 Tax=Arundo donax TaxID=35708 RepID=A0A0A9DPV9_ARUDO